MKKIFTPSPLSSQGLARRDFFILQRHHRSIQPSSSSLAVKLDGTSLFARKKRTEGQKRIPPSSSASPNQPQKSWFLLSLRFTHAAPCVEDSPSQFPHRSKMRRDDSKFKDAIYCFRNRLGTALSEASAGREKQEGSIFQTCVLYLLVWPARCSAMPLLPGKVGGSD